MGAHLERWAALVRARREQMDGQLAALGGPPEDWWAGRAPALAEGIADPVRPPPLGLPQIVERLDRSQSVLDVGAGPGRYAVPLARAVRHLTLVEPSPAMAALAREQLAAAGLENWSLVQAGWLEAAVEPASALLLANVLNPHEDLAPWIERALAHAEDWLFIVHGTLPDGLEPLQRLARAFHGEERVPQPALAELIPALHELGVYPEVQMIERRFRRAYASAADAARDAAATLLVAPTPAALRRIRSLLRRDLRRLPDGRVAMPEILAPFALLSWRLPKTADGRWRWTPD